MAKMPVTLEDFWASNLFSKEKSGQLMGILFFWAFDAKMPDKQKPLKALRFKGFLA
ncbi:hypothetical protein AB434_3183 [Heyndrickxia coagulans]|jgi:hypothetical protein|uniref:Uncharacterized protein n=2 Tax=Bacillaceae TaxID=186817 RepID=A0AAN0WBY0_HEYCO|nr:hypothetical protein SB48_HM08orf03329 [Heyndrickxia coagulans]AKN55588.1 hypothetical protein AB434_3183 [Heyndrickxia coagulans]KYC61215.1 hypothetical protein B4100_3315 [Heyndrickxia coagulans]KYC87294.1 hypothetical protein B4096_3206 [Heyndrickxia coagulans]WNE63099.1 hypothetical protein KIY57_08510 [Heyndrickxia coagulans]